MPIPHVVMIVANDITNDTRVLKEAVAVGEAGYRVTLLGVAASGQLAIDEIDGDVVMIRVPGRFVLRDERNRRRQRRRSWRLIATKEPAPARAARIAARMADLKGQSGRALALRRAGSIGLVAYRAGTVVRTVQNRRWSATRKAVALHSRIAGYEGRKAKELWRRWDSWMAQWSRPVNWRKVIPEADDYEAIFGDLLDRLLPDVIHAHDMHVVGVASRAAGRAALRGRDVKVVYDAHEYVPGLSRYGGRTPRLISAWAQHEGEYIRAADRVITVSPAIARTLLQRYKLNRSPTVVINSPRLPDAVAEGPDIRTSIGLPPEVPLIVYSGGVTQARGVETAIAALPHMPNVHLAVVCVPSTQTRPVAELRKLAERLQVNSRVHYLDPVTPTEVVSFLRTADVGLIPILRYPSHEMALPNKVFEYTFAGLPVVTSDMPTLAEFVATTGVGEVFEAENVMDLAVKVKRVLDEPERYRERAAAPELRQEMCWETQAGHVRALYAELVGLPQGDVEKRRLVIGPRDVDGSATSWAQVIEGAEVVDRHLTPADLPRISHMLMVNWKSLLGSHSVLADLPLLAAARVKHAVIAHDCPGGTEISVLETQVQGYPGTTFMTDRDLAASIPSTTWLPLATTDAHHASKVLHNFVSE